MRLLSLFAVSFLACSGAAMAQPDPVPIPEVKMYPDKPEADIDPQMAPKPLPNAKLALIGGTIRTLDPIRYRMTLDVFGGGKLNTIFDQRTKITKNGKDIDVGKLNHGDHVYLDTQNIHGTIFARQIQVQSGIASAALRGQIVSFNPASKQLRVRDYLAQREIELRVDPSSNVTHHGQPAPAKLLVPGALVSTDFVPQRDGRNIQTVDIIAAPGEAFTFFGDVTFIDLSRRRLALMNKTDDRAYEVLLTGNEGGMEGLGVGSEVSLQTRFDGQNYVTESVKVTRASALEKPESK